MNWTVRKNFPATKYSVSLQARLKAPAALAPSPDIEISFINLRNKVATVQDAGFVTPMFGVPFRRGQIPAGTFPHFQAPGGLACPATLGGFTSWDDGSMKFCAAMLRIPVAVAASGITRIGIRSGGNAPVASSLGLSNFTTADLSVELTGVTELTGVWNASLNTAITDADETALLYDGPAGRVYRIRGDFKQSGSRHGQLVCYHYVAALQNASGGLLGVRYLGKVAQPWGDVGQGLTALAPVYAGPAPTKRVAKASLKAGATVVRALQGHNTSDTSFGDDLGIGHYTSFFTCGLDGQWDYFQGGGSAANDSTVRVEHNKAYWVNTKLIPPYDTEFTPTSTSVLNYRPYGNGWTTNGEPGMFRPMNSGGERGDIAVIPVHGVKHFMTQNEQDERAMRVYGLVSSSWRCYIRLKSTGQPIPVIDIEPSYAGMGTVKTGTRWWPGVPGGSETFGIQFPIDNTSLWASEYEPSHRPGAPYYPYLATGEPQYLDLLTDHGTGQLLAAETGHREMNVVNPTRNTLTIGSAGGRRDVILAGTRYKGGGFLFGGGQTRVMAWGTRDITQAAAIYPDTCPYGTGVRLYLRQTVNAMYTSINKYNELLGPAWNACGIYDFDTRETGIDMWCCGYMSNSVCHQTSILPNAQMETFRKRLGRHWSEIAAKNDIACSFSYMASYWKEDNTMETDSGEILHGIFYSPSDGKGCQLIFDGPTNSFTISDSYGAWQPQNGDVFAFQYPPAGLETYYRNTSFPFDYPVDRRKMYVINATGQTGQLSYTPGGAPIPVTAPMSVQGFLMRVKNMLPRYSITGDDNSGNSYPANIASAIRHHAACGDDVTAARIAVDSKITLAGVPYGPNPKNKLTFEYPTL